MFPRYNFVAAMLLHAHVFSSTLRCIDKLWGYVVKAPATRSQRHVNQMVMALGPSPISFGGMSAIQVHFLTGCACVMSLYFIFAW